MNKQPACMWGFNNYVLRLSLLSLLLIWGGILISCSNNNNAEDDGGYGETLQVVIDRGLLNCGVNPGLSGFANINTVGEWEGIDVDVCRSVAAAILGDATKVTFVPLTGKERFTALQSGEIDLLSRNTTWTATRDSSLGVNFAGVTYYDGQGFLLRKSLGATNPLELSGATVCIQSGTTTELNLSDYFRQNNLIYKPITFDTPQQAVGGFESERCDVLTSDISQLVALRTTLLEPDSVIILNEIISKEPLGPVVRQGDDQWFNIVKWTVFLRLGAEEYGLSSQTADAMLVDPASPSEVKRMLSVEGEIYKNLGLDTNWGYQVIKQVGNYGESYDRNVGEKSSLNLPRGWNNLWSQGGLHYGMPFR